MQEFVWENCCVSKQMVAMSLKQGEINKIVARKF